MRHTGRVRTDPRLLVVVALGGAVGTGLRYGLNRLVPPSGGVPWATLAENLLGALLLGVLLESLVRAGAEDARRRYLRLGLGTGLLGGFTTFSSLALETRNLLAAGDVVVGLAYPLGSVVVGVVAATVGVTLAARVRGHVGLVPPDPDAQSADPPATDRRIPPVPGGPDAGDAR